ncbi:hypothetical protein PN466_22820 [Roseofilum reptotaenium CS-1145]|uniref:Transposase n=1 Tax=Roseofilum reptotaenium AO1-A TaxID=1925591 RepID=A0A1L9QMY4_9CYAN|nr:hypothetical protein [Roseofilum reptotaenium]MDB9519781.1 hypothetical protein [Roseofilum reptotaenium CS-1145]OJJ24043.1 hypothetical protein BI308_18845 [Roseofilum reptotaenium AO1-A]
MAKPADIGSKRLIGLNPDRWVEWVTKMPDLQYIGMESTSFEWVSRQTDVLLRVRSPQQGEFLVVNELQLYYNAQMPRRMQAYAALAEEKYQLPVYPVLVNLLKPDGKQPIPTRYESEFGGLKALREYKVINLWEIEARTILDPPIRPLIPFVPLLKNGDQELVVQEAVRRLRADEQLQDFETLLGFFANFVLDTNLVKQILRWDMSVLEASPLYREMLEQARKTVLQQGIEQGIEQERRKTVENLMRLRFQTIDPELEAIVPKLIALPTEEVFSLILQKSQQELLEQFSDRN